MPQKKDHVLRICLNEDEFHALKRICDETGRSMSAVARILLVQWLAAQQDEHTAN